MSLAWFFEDIESPKFVRAEEGVAFWIRHVEWKTGPNSGKQGYVASIHTPGRQRTGSVVPNRHIALEDGNEQMNIVLAELREEIKKQKAK